jgi:hypothetical protein
MNLSDFTPQDLEVLKSVATTGVGFTVNSGLDAIHLDALAKLAYQIFYPELRKIQHIQPEMAGERWGGQSYQWKSITAPNASGLVAPVSPGNRNAISSITSVAYAAPYCTLGYDQSVQDEEFEQERGFDDPVKNARITTMHSILRMYDIGVTSFNRGTDSNGFVLGAANAPAALTLTTAGGALAGLTAYVYVVELTAFGASNQNVNAQHINPATGVASAAAALVPYFIRTPANATSSESVPNGVGKPSTSVNVVVTGGSPPYDSVVATAATPKAGAFAWAWFVSTTGSTTATAYLHSITQVPSVTISTLPLSTQTLAAFNTLQGGVDTSYNGSSSTVVNTPAPEFDGEFAYIASQNPANFIKMGGLGWTPDGVGGVLELENAIRDQFLTYQTVPDEIVCGVNAINPISACVQSGANYGFGFRKEIGEDGSVNAGGIIKNYRLKFSQTGDQAIIPVSVSPNIPANAVWLPNRYNPFVTTSSTIPSNLQLAEIKPMYSLDYAKTRRTWELGTYVQTTLVKRAPFLGFVFSGGSPTVI